MQNVTYLRSKRMKMYICNAMIFPIVLLKAALHGFGNKVIIYRNDITPLKYIIVF